MAEHFLNNHATQDSIPSIETNKKISRAVSHRAWWCVPVSPAVRRQKQEDHGRQVQSQPGLPRETVSNRLRLHLPGHHSPEDRVPVLNSSCAKLKAPCVSSAWSGGWMSGWAGPGNAPGISRPSGEVGQIWPCPCKWPQTGAGARNLGRGSVWSLG